MNPGRGREIFLGGFRNFPGGRGLGDFRGVKKLLRGIEKVEGGMRIFLWGVDFPQGVEI